MPPAVRPEAFPSLPPLEFDTGLLANVFDRAAPLDATQVPAARSAPPIQAPSTPSPAAAATPNPTRPLPPAPDQVPAALLATFASVVHSDAEARALREETRAPESLLPSTAPTASEVCGELTLHAYARSRTPA